METRENTIAILVYNRPDVMARIAGIFSGKGFNIETIAVNITDDPTISKIILTTWGNQETIVKIEKQLRRMVDVIEVDDLTGKKAVRREMVLVRLKVLPACKAELMEAVDRHKWHVVSSDGEYRVLEVTGDKEEIEQALQVLKPIGMDDFTRSGTVALSRCNNNSTG